MPEIQSILTTQSERVDAAVSRFDRRVERITRKVRGEVLDVLSRLDVSPSGRILDTPENRMRIRAAEAAFRATMEQNGYSQAAVEYLDEFSIQRETLADALRSLGVQLRFDSADVNLENRLVGATFNQLMDVVGDSAAHLGLHARAMVGVGTLDHLTDIVEGAVGKARATAHTIADTGISMFYRKLSERKNREAEIDKFYYAGPLDILTRPFCRSLILRGRVFTREKIEQMDNDQLPDVFVTGGGYNCRHQWVGVPDER